MMQTRGMKKGQGLAKAKFEREAQTRSATMVQFTRHLDGLSWAVCFGTQPPDAPKCWTLDDFEVQGVVGEGGDGTVFKAKHKASGHTVALKKFSDVSIFTAEDELEIHKTLDHPGIVKMYGLFFGFEEADDSSEEVRDSIESAEPRLPSVYLVLEFCLKGTLNDIMGVSDDGRIPEPRASRILAKVMESLDYLHNNKIVHRDIKPANILITEKDEVKLADFGISTYCLSQSRRETLVGTPSFMAPEVLTVKIKKCLRNKGYDFKVDSWSLGILMYWMLTGTSPYPEEYTALSLDKDELQEKFGGGKSRPPIDFPDFISKDAKNLILGLLQVYPGSRLSVKEALNHRWIQNSTV